MVAERPESSLRHSPANQKYSLSANCISRGSPGPPESFPRMGASVLLTCPKDPYGPVEPGPQKTNELGLEKFG